MPPHDDLLEVARAVARRDPSALRLLRARPSLARDALCVGATRAASTE